jgi:hypothetical protein
VQKNPLPPETIHHRGKLEDVKRKLLVFLVKPESHRRCPTPSVEFF